MTGDLGVTIYLTDDEEIRRAKREQNKRAIRKDHQRGAERLPLGIPKECKVEQPRAQLEHITTPTYKQGDTQYTNGEVRCVYINGINRKEIRMGFAGRARSEGEMNGGQGEEGYQ